MFFFVFPRSSLRRQETESYTMTDEYPVAVIDVGTDSMQIGMAGEDCPQHTIPTVVGRPTFPSLTSDKDYFLGQHARDRSGVLKLRNTVKRGIIVCFGFFSLYF